MLASQRQDRIVAEVRAHGAVRVADLVEQLDVSEMTVRRDITELDRAGLVRRVHGGAVAVDGASRPTDEPGFEEKSTWATAEKATIATLAAATVEPGQAIALSAGTTTHLLAQRIAADPALRPLTVVTNSLPVAQTLHRAVPGAAPLDVILTGGTRTPSDALVGPVADAALATLRVDRLYLGVHGLDESGLMTPNLAEAATDRALLRCSAAVTVLADHTKWGVMGLARIAALEEVDVLVSDAALPEPARAVLADAGCDLLSPTPDDDPTRQHAEER
ncbi:DeoR/GlpR transcriptional regulator [Cellulomonas triticagri]|uniref:DeoR/GlpR transcriptional regulator n=1 Tax=Cellulomonas triticagri TaxID=2483352 RepID=A0A3M2J2G0_9CELL|nr:DeoR/GlpR family DNA-binding transcription regulator [Cellulomonas triticagri]RMI07004.1 DeoR/GlpR transcriptional regulator [Cellulomonas triticagri]